MATLYFYHNSNGTININGNVFSEELFKLIEPTYKLPKGAKGRRYEPGKKHTLTYGGTYQKGQPKKWAPGDRYISRSSELQYLVDNFEEHDLIHMRQVLKKQIKNKMKIIGED
jgi:hypothetical protein